MAKCIGSYRNISDFNEIKPDEGDFAYLRTVDPFGDKWKITFTYYINSGIGAWACTDIAEDADGE